MASVVALIGFGALVVNNYKTKTSFKYSNKSAEDLKPQQNPQDPVNSAIIEDAKAQDELRKTVNYSKFFPKIMLSAIKMLQL